MTQYHEAESAEFHEDDAQRSGRLASYVSTLALGAVLGMGLVGAGYAYAVGEKAPQLEFVNLGPQVDSILGK